MKLFLFMKYQDTKHTRLLEVFKILKLLFHLLPFFP